MKPTSLARRIATAVTLSATVALAPLAQAQDKEIIERSFCVFDPVGANGPLFSITKTFQPTALKTVSSWSCVRIPTKKSPPKTSRQVSVMRLC